MHLWRNYQQGGNGRRLICVWLEKNRPMCELFNWLSIHRFVMEVRVQVQRYECTLIKGISYLTSTATAHSNAQTYVTFLCIWYSSALLKSSQQFSLYRRKELTMVERNRNRNEDVCVEKADGCLWRQRRNGQSFRFSARLPSPPIFPHFQFSLQQAPSCGLPLLPSTDRTTYCSNIIPRE